MAEVLALYESHSPAVTITLNQPHRRNALNQPLIKALTEAFERARDDAKARCVILTGAGTAFCAGMDLAELAESVDRPEGSPPNVVAKSEVGEKALRLAKLYDLIYTLPKPTIAAVNGAAVAGGAGLLTVCDLALAVPDARIGYPEVRRGLVAAMVMPHLLRHVGERTARYLLLTGETIEAAEAQRVGLINAVVPSGSLFEQSLAWARLIAECGPGALANSKELLHQFSRQVVSVAEAANASAGPRLTEEAKQGLRAFFAKRPPPWTVSQEG
jgi:methylglutaconyl-CoA hydratase